MTSKKTKEKLMKRRICSIARVLACTSFLILTIIGVSSLVRAMSLETIANENGIPSIWQAASLGNPSQITIPITYWDQRQDDCNAANRQFEWTECRLYAKGIIQGVVKDHLGHDNLPIPSYTNASDAWNAYHDVFTANVTGGDPVQPEDNFYRWFHETSDASGKQLSKQFDREVTFDRTGQNTYSYGSKGKFPLDDVTFSKQDNASQGGHNFHFTAHMRIPMKIAADGTEEFWFSGDDDVWVFLNGKLVLDLGGLHMDTEGSFKIDANGNVISTVDNVADQSCRQSKVKNPLTIGYDVYNNQVESCPRAPKTTTIKAGLKKGDVVNLDFFYAERSTSESNTRITISNMNWPISADSNIDAKILGKIDGTRKNLVEFQTSITNRDPALPLDLERIAAYIDENTDQGTTKGFLPLDETTLWYSTTPNDENSWQPVKVSAPANTATGFNLETPLRMTPAGTPGDTLYFRYFGETSEHAGTLTSTVSYYTSLNGTSGVTYDYDSITYDNRPAEYQVTVKYLYEDDTPAAEPYQVTYPTGTDFSIDSPSIDDFTPDITTITGTVTDSDLTYIVRYTKTPVVTPDPEKHTLTIHYIYEDGTPAAEPYIAELEPEVEFEVLSPAIDGHTPDQDKISGQIHDQNLEYIVRYTKSSVTPPVNPEEPTTPDLPNIPTIPGSDLIDGDLVHLAPLGEVAFVPNTGIISDAVAAVFEESFAEIIMSQGFIMGILLLFSGSFAVWFSLRKFADFEPAINTARSAKKTTMSTRAKSTKTLKSTTKTSKTSAKSTKSTRKTAKK